MPTGAAVVGVLAPDVPPSAGAPGLASLVAGLDAICCTPRRSVDLLAERADPDIVVIELLADDADIVGEVVDNQFLVSKPLTVRVGLLVDLGIERFDGLGDRSEQILQLLTLLMEHAQVGCQLPMFFVGCECRRGDRHRQSHGAAEADGAGSHHGASHLAVMTKCARRFFANADSSCPGSNGNSFP